MKFTRHLAVLLVAFIAAGPASLLHAQSNKPNIIVILADDLGFADLTTSTSYATQKQDFRADLTFPLSTLIDLAFGYPANEFIQDQATESEKFTQEVRLTSESDRFDWLAGVYYTSEDGLIEESIGSFDSEDWERQAGG